MLVADPDVDAGKALAAMLSGWGVEPVLVHDGVEAILTIQRSLPRLVVLEASLPKMFGFQVCELMKRNEQLREIPVVLVGSITHRERYRREASETYGADAYLERPGLAVSLQALLRERGLVGADAPSRPAPPTPIAMPTPPSPPPIAEPRTPAGPEPRTPAPPEPRPPAPPEPRPPAPPEPRRAAEPPRPAPAPSGAMAAPASGTPPEIAAGIARAERLARIIVSDIVLYNPERFEAAIRSGDVVSAMAGELEEGRAHFRERIEERIRERKDFLGEELVRVARQRGLQ